MKDDGTQTFNNVLFGNDYTVVEDVIPTNWALDHVRLQGLYRSDSHNRRATVTFDIDADTDILDCTYYNEHQVGALKILKNSTRVALSPRQARCSPMNARA